MLKLMVLGLVVVGECFAGNRAAAPQDERRDRKKGSPDNIQKFLNILRSSTVTQVNANAQSFTVMANGKVVTFSAKTLRVLPRVGDTIDVTYTQTPGGPMEASSVRKLELTEKPELPKTTITEDKNWGDRQTAEGKGRPSDKLQKDEKLPPPKPKIEKERDAALGNLPSKALKSDRPDMAAPPKIMTGTVTRVNGIGNSFTISANGNEATFSAKALRVLPTVGTAVDVTYTQTAGGPMEAVAALPPNRPGRYLIRRATTQTL